MKEIVRVAADDQSSQMWAAQLREHGVVLLRNVFPQDALSRLKDAAVRCFQAIGSESALPEHYRFSRASHSLLLTALTDFGCGAGELLKPLSVPGLAPLFSESIGSALPVKPETVNLEQSWLRKKFAPPSAPASGYHLQNWHQDGALGVHFPLQPGPLPSPTDLMTCWIPLHACGFDSPGLEFVRFRLPALLHFTELDDSALRRRFPPQEFWAPALEFGDGLVFLNSVLHRTYVRPGMQDDRLSIEYRIFPGQSSSGNHSAEDQLET